MSTGHLWYGLLPQSILRLRLPGGSRLRALLTHSDLSLEGEIKATELLPSPQFRNSEDSLF